MKYLKNLTGPKSLIKIFVVFVLVCTISIPTIFLAPIHAAPPVIDLPVVVSMGDSYSSGEGNTPFYGSFDEDKSPKDQNQDWLAHRSTINWPGQLVVPSNTPGLSYKLGDNRDSVWYFVASSGAETKHIDKEEFEKPYTQFSSKWPFALIDVKGASLPKQIEIFENLNRVDYVTITIGGNDLGFAGVIEAAVFDIDTGIKYIRTGTLKKKIDEAKALYDSKVRSDLERVYGTIRSKVDKDTKILVVGYPPLINVDGGGGFFRKDEAEMINEAVDDFNAKIKTLIAEQKDASLIFVPVAGEFKGHEAYTANPYINGIIPGTKPEDLNLIDIKSAFSMHPNAEGIEHYRKAVQAAINNNDQVTEFVYDVSTSMNDRAATGSKLSDAINAGKQVAIIIDNTAKQYGTSTKAGVSSFSNTSYINHGMTSDFNEIRNTLSGLHTIGGTNMLAGIRIGISELNAETANNKVMIYLSDGVDTAGNSDASILAAAQEAKDSDIKIYTIGFGRSSDLDENLLRNIATITGGEYSHADPSSAIDIAMGFVKSQLSGVGAILHETQGTVGQGATAPTGTFDISNHGDLQICTLWPGSTMDVILTDPNGIEVTDKYPGYTVVDGDTIEQVFIENAKIGTWTTAVYGTDVSMPEEPFYTVAAFTETPEVEVAAPIAGGGGAPDNSSGLLFILIAIAICLVGGVFAYTKRGNNKGETKMPETKKEPDLKDWL